MATHIDNPNSPISSNTSDPHASDSMDRTDPSSNKSSSQNSSETPFYDQMFLHHSDPPSLKLATTLLSEHNYTRWKRSVEVSLLAKNKLGFVNGDCRRPLSDAKSIARWDQCNNMIISWLLHSVEREIAESVLYCKTAAQIWQELATRYGKTNRTNLFQIQKELSSISQGNSSITLYFTRLKKLWDEYMIAVEDKICSCGSNEVAVSILKDQQVIQFLVGLNESFSMVRSNILMMQPSPSLDNVYKLVLQDETQRGLHNMSTTDEEAVAMYSHNRNNSSQRQAYVRGQSPPYKPMFCDHCKARNHNIDKCWKLHGYPTAAAPGISFCDHCKVAGHVIAKCWKVHGYPAGHKLAATSFSQEQMNQLLALLPQTNKQSSSDGSHNAFLAGPFDETSLGDW